MKLHFTPSLLSCGAQASSSSACATLRDLGARVDHPCHGYLKLTCSLALTCRTTSSTPGCMSWLALLWIQNFALCRCCVSMQASVFTATVKISSGSCTFQVALLQGVLRPPWFATSGLCQGCCVNWRLRLGKSTWLCCSLQRVVSWWWRCSCHFEP